MADPDPPPVPPRPAALPSSAQLDDRARLIMEAHWRSPGYTVPNPQVYPAQFLWDSCFHAIVWAHLGEPDRAVTELRNLFAHQAPDGFVAHMTYWHDPDQHADFWGRRWTSCITQPPMYGHALAELARHGVTIDDDLLDAAERGLRFLHHHRGPDGASIVHPWESGCDDSPRWDAWCPGGWTPARWRQVKGELVEAIEVDERSGSPVGSRTFEVNAAGFEALVAFNADELFQLGGWMTDQVVADLGGGLDDRWHKRWGTFADHARAGGGRGHGERGHGDPARDDEARGGLAHGERSSVPMPRTLEALLPVLVSRRPRVVDEVFAQLRDPAAFGGAVGPPSVHRADPAFDPSSYWRGPTWPQLTYLLWVAARRHRRPDDAARLGDALVRGAVASGFAEYWHPDTGAGLGARPQSWTCLAAVVAAADPID